MADFLVRTLVGLPADLSTDERRVIVAAEHDRARQLRAEGTLRGLWRIPGASANLGVWRVRDATQLHQILTALPMARWMTFEVTALADHPVMTDPPLAKGADDGER